MEQNLTVQTEIPTKQDPLPEATQTAPIQEDTAAVPDGQTGVPDTAPADTAQVATDHNELLKPFLDEYQKTGSLSTESKTQVAQALGTTPEIIDLFLDGVNYRTQARVNAVTSAAGGEVSYSQILDWAAKTLSAEQAQIFNDKVMNGTIEEATDAVKNLKAKFVEANGSPKSEQQKVINSASPVPSAAPATAGGASTRLQPFKSFSELQEAQRDPRYFKDPAFRDEVYTRAFLSKF